MTSQVDFNYILNQTAFVLEIKTSENVVIKYIHIFHDSQLNVKTKSMAIARLEPMPSMDVYSSVYRSTNCASGIKIYTSTKGVYVIYDMY